MPESFSPEPVWFFSNEIFDEAVVRDLGEMSTSHAMCRLSVRPLWS